MRNFFTPLLLFVFILISGFDKLLAQCYTPPSYCTTIAASNNGNYGMGITNVTLGSTINNTTAAGTGAPIYFDYTSQVVNATAGGSVSYSIKIGTNYQETIRIFIDYNLDGTYNTSAPELVLTSTLAAGGTVTGSYTVPAGTAAGIYRVRVASDAFTTAPNPCGPLVYSAEVEDYSMVVASSTSDVQSNVFTSPTTFIIGTTNVIGFSFRNLSTSTISTIDVGYQLGSNSPVTQSLTGLSIASGALYTHTFSTNLTLTADGTYNIKAWATNSNGGGSITPANDTICRTFVICSVPLSGTYTINPTGSGAYNYKSFGAADSAMINCGIAGPVVFNVVPGTYNEQVDFPAIPGASAVNTITFDGGAGNSFNRIVSFATNVGAPYVMRFNNCSYITLKNLTIRSSSATDAWVVHFVNGTSNRVSNCVIDVNGGAAATTSNLMPVLINGSASLLGTSTSTANNHIIDSCTLNAGYYGVYCNSTNGANTVNVLSNSILSSYYYGLYFNSSITTKLVGNTINMRTNNASNIGIYLINCSATGANFHEIRNNKVLNVGQYGIELLTSSGSGSSYGQMYNNMIGGGFRNTSSTYGIYTTSSLYKIYHNSIYFDAPTTSGLSAAFYATIGSSNDVRNNIFAVMNPSAYAAYCVWLAAATNVSNLDYNIYYNLSSYNLLNILGADINYTNFTSAGGGANSLNTNPLFVSSANLHTSMPCNNGLNLSLTTDIDGDSRSATPDIGADEIVSSPSNDLSVMKINSPRFPMSLGTQNINVTIRNLGSNTITSGTVSYQVNGGSVVSGTFSGSLAPCDTLNYTFSAPYTFVSGSNLLKVFTSLPNGTPDANISNDTVQKAFCRGFSGVYTINPLGSGGTNYLSFSAAVSDLMCSGVYGPTVFNVSPGTYNEQVTINGIFGVSAVNQVTFQSSTGIASDVNLTFSANSTNNFTLRLNAVNNIKFRNLSISATNTSYGTALYYTGNASSDSFYNVVFNSLITTSNTSNLSVIVAPSSTVSNFMYFDTCRVLNGAYGAYIQSSSNNTLGASSQSTSFNNCDFQNQYSYGMYFQYLDGIKITKNRITTNSTLNSYYGIYNYWIMTLADVNKTIINANKISGAIGGTGIYNYYVGVNSSNTAARRSLISNNMIDIGSGSNATYGIRDNTDYMSDFYHNSVNIGTSDNTSNSAAAFFEGANSSPIGVSNNIFAAYNGAPAVRFNAVANYPVVNYNNYYTTGTNLAYLSTTAYTTMALWRTASSRDANSININPGFLANNNLHVNTACNNAAAQIGSVTTDYDGDTRSSTPDIGADEVATLPYDATVTALRAPLTTLVIGGSPYTVTITVRNNGTSTINSLDANFSINGTINTQTYTAGSGLPVAGLAPCDTAQLTFTTTAIFASGGPSIFKVFTGMINASADQNHSNDTITTLMCTPFSGTFTINALAPASQSNFTSFSAALTALYNCGVGGAVTFNVAAGSGPYNEQLTFSGPINGVTASTNTVTFNGGATKEAITFNASVATSQHTIRLGSVKGIILNNLTINATNLTNGIGVLITNSNTTNTADSNTIQNCVINVAGTTSSNTAGISISSNASPIGTGTPTNGSGNNNLIQNNIINGGYYGITANGYSTTATSFNRNNFILNNTLNNIYYYAIYVQNQSKNKTNGNKISMMSSNTASYGIYFSYVDSFELNKNKINNVGTYGMYLNYANYLSGTGTYRSSIINNMIGGNFFNTTAYGIFHNTPTTNKYLDIFHNSVSINNNSTAYAFYLTSTSTGLDIRNNSFVTYNGTTAAAYIYTSGSTIVGFNYNNIWNSNTAATQLISGAGTSYSTNSWIGANTFNANSKWVDPKYISQFNNLHCIEPGLNDAGTNIATVTDDIDGDPRPIIVAGTVDIGADEFTVPNLNIGPLAIISPASPITPGLQNIVLAFRNYGTSTISSANISYKVGVNGTPKTAGYSGTLPYGNNSVFTFSGANQYNFTGSSDTIYVYTSAPNGGVDGYPINDTLFSVLCAPLTGNFTINPSLPVSTTNFQTFAAAMAKLQSCGVGGPVVFSVAAGTYTEQVDFTTIFGTSATNTITFDGGNGNAATRIITAVTSATLPYVWRFDNCSYVNLKNLTIRSTDITNAWNVNFMNAVGCGVTKCIIDNPNFGSSGNSNVYGILLNGNITSAGTTSTINADNRVDSTTVSFGYYNIGSYVSNGNNTNYFRYNTLNNAAIYGIFCSSAQAVKILYNTIATRNPYYSNAQSIYLSGANPNAGFYNEVSYNRITNTTYYAIYCSSSGTAASYSQMYNNMIYGPYLYPSNSWAIYMSGASYWKVYHNSVNYVYPNTSYAAYGLYVSGGSFIEVLNNIFSNTDATATNYTPVFVSPLTAVSMLDYNVYFNAGNSQLLNINGVILNGTNFKGAVSSGGGGVNSLNVNPSFVSSTDLHVTVPCNNGLNLGLTTDLDGDSRGSSPDIGADESTVTPPNNDIGVLKINSPTSPITPGTQSINVTLKNFGGNLITTSNIYYQVNGGSIQSATFSGSLNTCDTSNYTFAVPYTFSGGINSIKVFTSLPNGFSDVNTSNDTIQASLCTSMSGVYTINPFGSGTSNFTSFTSAANAISCGGITGPVTFNVSTGTYTEQFILPLVPGSSATNTITFASSTGNAADVVLQYNGASSAATNYVIYMFGASYTTFKNMTFQTANTTYGVLLWQASNSRFNTFQNVIFNGPSVSSTSTNNALVYANNSTANIPGQGDDNNTFNQCAFNNGSYGIYYYGSYGSYYSNNCVFSNSTFTNQYYTGLYIWFHFNFLCSGNTITTNSSYSNYYGIYQYGGGVSNSGVAKIVKNNIKVSTNGYGMFLQYFLGANTLVANNMIYIGTGVGTSYALYAQYCGTKIYNNTFNSFSGLTTGQTVYLYNNSSSYGINDFKLNIVSATGNGTASGECIFSVTNTTTLQLIDSNVYYQGTGAVYFGSFNGTLYATFAAWKTGMGVTYDPKSIVVNPNFVSSTNHHINQTTNLFSVPVNPNVPDDIDNIARCISITDVGADHHPGNNDIGISRVISPNAGVANSGPQDVVVVLRNYGGNTVVSANVSYKDNFTTKTIPWSGTLNTCDTAVVTFTGSNQYNFSGPWSLKFFTDSPNGSTDANAANDTMSASGCVGMAGTFTINPLGSGTTNYLNFATAISALTSCGVSGPVVFNVASGTYNEQVSIPNIPGTNAVNTITFDGGNGNSASRIITATTNSTNPHIVRFNACNYVTFRNFTLRSTGTTDAWVVNFMNAGNCRLNNCLAEITGTGAIYTGTTTAPVVINGSTTTLATTTSVSDGITVDSCTFNNGYYGIYTNVNNTASTININNNSINDAYQYGVYALNPFSLRLMRNTVNMLVNRSNAITTNYGIYIQSLNNTGATYFEINSNKVLNPGQYGVYLNSCSNSGTAFNRVINNMIGGGFTNLAGDYGLYLTSSTRAQIYHNSINLDNTNITTLAAALYITSGSGNDVRNNNLAVSNSLASLAYSLYLSSPTVVSNLDYNNYYNLSSSNLLNISNINFSSSNYKSTGGSNSMNTNPFYISALNLHTTLPCNNGQNLGVTNDIDGNSRGTSPDIGADEIVAVSNDLSVLKINAPAAPLSAGSQSINITLRNLGSNTISSATLAYTVNGGSTVTQAWTGTLAPCDTLNFTFTTPYTFGSGGSFIKVYSANPNASSDANKSNDTAQVNLCLAMSGVYTINPSGSGATNYTTFNAAVNDLICGGVSGPVVFNVAAGTYVEQISVPAINGVTASNTITFDGGNGNATTRVISSVTTSTLPHIVRFNACNFVTFRNLTLRSIDATAAFVAHFMDGTNNRLNNCVVEVVGTGAASTSSTLAAVVVNGNLTSMTTASTLSNNNTIDSCILNSGYYNFYSSISVATNVLNVFNNTMNDAYQYGFNANNTFSLRLRGNTINGLSNRTNAITSNYGIYLVSLNNTGTTFYEVSGNKVINAGQYGIYLNSCSNSGSGYNMVFNNMIGGGFRYPSAGGYGLYVNSCSRTRIYHNSINFDAPSTAATNAALYVNAGSLNDIRNNNISIGNAATAGAYSLYVSAASALSNLDFNNYWNLSSANLIYLAGTIYTSSNVVAPYPSGGGYSAKNIDPLYLSSLNLHTVSPCNNGASLGIATDFDGQSRASIPDIGADEIPTASNDIGVMKMNPPAFPISASSQTINITIYNFGSNVINSAKFNYSVNGGSIISENWSGTLQPCDTLNYTFTTPYTFTSGPNNFKLFTSLPNNAADAINGNDTLQKILCTAASGTYTINASGSGSTNFTSFTQAINAMLCSGVSGPVKIIVAAGTYNEQIVVPPIQGVSAANTITFDGGNGNAASRILTFSGTTSAPATLTLYQSSYIVFRNITIQTTSIAQGWGVNFFNATNSQLNNCVVEVTAPGTITTTTNFMAVVMSGGNNTGTYNTSSTLCSNNIIDSSNIKSGYYGIYTSINNGLLTNFFNKNNLTDQYQGAYYFNGAQTVKCTNNSVNMRTTITTNDAISLVSCNPVLSQINQVSGNTIINAGNRGIFISASNGSTSDTGQVFNNMIGGGFRNTAAMGIYNTGGRWKFWNNSINNDAPLTSTGAGIYFAGGSVNDVRNNIFAITNSSSTAAYCFYTSSSTFVTTLDNNNYFNKLGSYALNLGGSLYTPAGVKSAYPFGGGLGALSIDPGFVSNTNLHISSACNNGVDLGLTLDIDGNTRTSPPDMGADEVALNSYDAAVVGIRNPIGSVITNGSPYTIMFAVRNNGSTVINTLDASYSINGVVNNETFTTSAGLPATGLNPCDSIVISFTNQATFNAGVSVLKVYTGLLNSSSDQMHLNDTAISVFCTPFAGSFTINALAPASGTNFKSFNAAVSAIYNCGISGPVVFNVASGSGPYNEQVLFNGVISGSSGVNTVTFKGGATKETITYDAAIAGSQYTIRLNGAKYIILDSLTINSTNNLGAVGVHLTNVADSNAVTNCNINIGGTLNNRAGVAIAGISTTTVAVAGNNGNYNLIQNNVIDGGNYAVIAFGPATGTNTFCYGNKIIGNTGTNSLLYGISLQSEDLLTVKNNTLSGITGNLTSEGIHAVYCERFDISYNRINNFGANGIYLQYANYQLGTGMVRARVVNNMIGGTFYAPTAVGINLATISRELDIFHNSVSMNNVANGYAFYMKQLLTGDYTGLDIRNNSFANYNSSTPTAYFFYGGSTTVPFNSLNYNNIWNNNSAVNSVLLRISNYTSNSWIGALGFNANSKFGDPIYYNQANNLHSFGLQLDNAGVNIASVTDDIDGQSRPMSPSSIVDIGADEYTPPIFNVINPAAVCSPTTVNLTAASVTTGSDASFTYSYWTNASATISLSNPSTVSTSGTYYIKADNGIGYVVIKPVVVVVNITPSAPSVTSPVTYCQGNTPSVLTATATTGNTLLWYTVATGGTGSVTAPTPSTTTAGTTTYYVCQISSSNCESPRSAIAVVVNATPGTPSVTTPVTYCQNATASALSATAASGNTLRWYTVATGGSFSTSTPTPSTASAGTTNYYVSQVTSLGCEGARNQIQVTVNPATAITTQPASVTQCAGTTVNFSVSAIGTGTLSYQWKKGGSTISGATSSSYSISNISPSDAGSYTVDVSSSCGGTVTSNPATITVASEIPLITPASALLCGGSTVTLVASATSTITSYQWKLNGNNIPGALSSSYVANSTGTYTVFVTYAGGCTNLSGNATVSTAPNPIPAFTINSTNQCLNANNYLFNNTSTISSGSMTYFWSFGDNTTSTATTPSKTYSAVGTYAVKLIATSNNGCKDSVTQNITILPKPTPSFTVNTSNQCLTGNSYVFTNTSSIASGAMNYKWDFGDGTTSTLTNPSKTYAASNTYAVKLVVSSVSGCKDSTTQTVTVYPKPTAAFSINASSQCVNGNSFTFSNSSSFASGTMSYFWNFGDNTTSTATSPSGKIYAVSGYYQVKLVVTTNNGCTDSSTQFVTVNGKPTAAFTINNSSQCQGSNSFVFTNTSSIASGTLSYAWNFGDGGTTNIANPVKSYSSSGTFAVKLVVTSNNGCIDSVIQNVTVNPNPQPAAPTGATSVCSSINAVSVTPITYTSTLISGLNYSWSVVGGSFSGASTGLNLNSVNIIWGPAGTGSVTVTVTNTTTNCSGSATLSGITINPSPNSIIGGNNLVCLNSTNYYTLSNTTGGTITGYNWTVTGGTLVSGQGTTGITVSWPTTGAKTITCTLTNSNGCTGVTPALNVTVNPNPTGTFTGTTTVCVNTPYTYTATTTGDKYVWVPVGGTISSQAGNTVSIIWNNTTTGSLQLYDTATTGCGGTSSQSITISGPMSSVITGSIQVCNNSSQTYAISGVTATSWSATGGTVTASTGTSATILWNTVGIQTITVNYANGSCNYSTTYSVNVNPLPTPSVAGSGTACTGITYSYSTSYTFGRTYNWTISAGGTITAGQGTNSISVVWNSAGLNTVTVSETITATGCSASSSALSVNVVTATTSTITGATNVCSGGSFTYSAPLSPSYTWTVSGGTISGSSNASTVTIVWGTAGSGSLSLITGNGTCNSSTTVAIITNATPAPVITGSNSICSGTAGIYSTAFNSNYTYNWTITNGTYTYAGNNNTINVTPNTGVSTVTVAVTTLLNGTTCSGSASKVVTVNTTPTVSLSGNTTVCANSSQTYTASGASTYSFNVSGGTVTSSSANTVTVSWGSNNGSVSVIGSSASGCNASAYLPIIVIPLPTVVISGSSQVCAGTTSSYSASPAGANYAWTVTGGTIIGSNTSQNININWGASGSGTVGVTVTSAAGCSDVKTMNITINNQPTPTITGLATVCQNTTQTYSVTGATGAAYNWSVNGGNVMSGAGTNSITVNWTMAGTGSVSIAQSNGLCIGTNNVNVTVNAAPAIPTVYKVGSVLSTNAVATSYQWYNGGVAIPGATNSTYTATSAGNYTVVVTNASGCSISSMQVIANVGIKGSTSITNVNVYPNPTSDNFTITATLRKSQAVTINLFDMNGKLIYSKEQTDADINFTSNISLEGFASGVYMVQLVTSEGVVQQRVIKE